MSPSKEQEVVIKAMRIIEKQGIKTELLLVGDADKGYLALLKALVKQTQTQGIEFHPFSRYPEEYFLKAQIVLVPSLAEPFGRVVIEAMSHGALVIASDSGGIKEIIQHKLNGILVEPNNPDIWAAGIKELILDKQLRIRIALHARAIVEQRYNQKNYCRDVLNVVFNSS